MVAAGPGRLELLEARLARLDGDGEACGESFIAPEKTCHKGGGDRSRTANIHEKLPRRDPKNLTHGEHSAESKEEQRFAVAVAGYTGHGYADVKAYQLMKAVAAGYSLNSYSTEKGRKTSSQGVLPGTDKVAEDLEAFIEKMPIFEGEVYRGLKLRSMEQALTFIDEIGRDGVITGSVESWSSNETVATNFSRKNLSMSQVAVVLKQKNQFGVPIAWYSTVASEDEVLMPSGINYRILSIVEHNSRPHGSPTGERSFEIEIEAIDRKQFSAPRKDASSALLQVLARLDRLELRIDARGADPGQLDLFGGGGPGTGKPCGESHIAAPLTCRKGGSAASKPTRKAQLQIGEERKTLEEFGREFHLRLTGGDRPAQDVWGRVGASVSNVLLRDPEYSTIWSTKLHKRAADMGEAVGVKPIVETDDFYGVPKIRAFDLTFEVGPRQGRPTLNRMEISAADGALVARNVFRQMAEMLRGLPDGTLLTANAWTQDGYGDQRAKMYQALGFEFPEDNPGHDGIALVKGGKIAKPIRTDSEADQEEEAFVAAALQLPEFGGGKPLSRVDWILSRLDRLELLAKPGIPGHLDARGFEAGQDLLVGAPLRFRGPSGAGQDHRISEAVLHGGDQRADGEGDGQPCGESFISPSYVCRKGGGTTTDSSFPINAQTLGVSGDAAQETRQAIKAWSGDHTIVFQTTQVERLVAQGMEVDQYSQEILKKLESKRSMKPSALFPELAIGEFHPLGPDAGEGREGRTDALERVFGTIPAYEGPIYRGVELRSDLRGTAKEKLARMIEGLSSGALVAHSTSWSDSEEVAYRFMNSPVGEQPAVVMKIARNALAVPITDAAIEKKEKEILMPPAVQMKVVAITEKIRTGERWIESQGESIPFEQPYIEIEVEAVATDHTPGRKRLDALLERLDALEERLDARRKAADPGQLDLFGGGGGPGTGKPCGEGHIAAPLTCHKGAGAGATPAAAPAAAGLDPSQPFTSEQKAAISQGIARRFLGTGPVRQSGEDLAGCLQKLGEQPGQAGENARKLLAFIHTEEPIVTATAYTFEQVEAQYTRNLGMGQRSVGPKMVEEMISTIKAMGIANPEHLEVLRQDKSLIGRERVEALEKTIQIVQNGYADDRVKRLEGELAAMPAKVRGMVRQQVTSELELARKLAASRAYTPLLDTIQDATLSQAGGCYVPGGRQVWVKSTAASNAGAIPPQIFDPREFGMEVSRAIAASAARTTPYGEQSQGLTSMLANQYMVRGPGLGVSIHIHELGHLIQYTANQVGRERVAIEGRQRIHRKVAFEPAVTILNTFKRGPSAYASLNAQEMFAESFVGYVMAPGTMKNAWPQLYDWVDRTVARAQKNAEELKGLPEDVDWGQGA